MNLFSHLEPEKKTSLGKSEVFYRQAASILTSGKGFMDEYDYTLNPYSGCTFGCTYCYAAFFSRSEVIELNRIQSPVVGAFRVRTASFLQQPLPAVLSL